MLLDARDLDRDPALAADVCIVGAGAAGITLALALRGSGLSVLLLEGGGLKPSEEAQDLFKGRMAGIDTWKLHRQRWRVLGGTTTQWAGWCMPFVPEDFERRDWIPGSGWPIGFDDLRPYYDRAHARLQLGAFDYDPASVSARTGRTLLPEATGQMRSWVFHFSPPTDFGEVYREDLDAAEDVRVYLHANLTQIELDDSTGRVAHLECATLEGGRFTAQAERFALALGGIENARMLLASNTQRAEGVANGNGLVGRYFMEHPHYANAVAWIAPEELDLAFYGRHVVNLPVDGHDRPVEVLGVLGLTTNTLGREGLPDFSASLSEVRFEDLDTDRPEASAARSLLDRSTAGVRLQRLLVRAEQTPEPDSRVTLCDTKSLQKVSEKDHPYRRVNLGA